MKTGVFINDLYRTKAKSTLPWMNELTERGHEVYWMFPDDVDQMRWRTIPALSADMSGFFEQSRQWKKEYSQAVRKFNEQLHELQDRRDDFLPGNAFTRYLSSFTDADSLHDFYDGQVKDHIRHFKQEVKQPHKQRVRRWLDDVAPYAEPSSIDMLVFRKAGKDFYKDANDQQILTLADTYRNAGQINDAHVVATMDKTFMRDLEQWYFQHGGDQPVTLPTDYPSSIDGIEDAVRKYGNAIVKPIDGAAGRGVTRVNHTPGGYEVIVQDGSSLSRYHTDREGLLAEINKNIKARPDDAVVVQEFAPDIASDGELRALVIDDEVVSVANTVPQSSDSYLSNVTKGASAKPVSRMPPGADVALQAGREYMRETGISVGRIDLMPYKGLWVIGEINARAPGTTAFKKYNPMIDTKLADAVENYSGLAMPKAS